MTGTTIDRCYWILLVALSACLVTACDCRIASSQEKDFDAYPDSVAKYLKRIYDQNQQPLAFREDYPGGLSKWQQAAREALRQKIGLSKIAASVGNHQPVVQLGDQEDLGQYVRQHGTIETEPDVRIPFWLLKPKGVGPWPLGVFPHGRSPSCPPGWRNGASLRKRQCREPPSRWA